MLHKCKHDGAPDAERAMRFDSESLECVAPDGVQRDACQGVNCQLWTEGEVNHFDLDKARADGDNTVPKLDEAETGDEEATLA